MVLKKTLNHHKSPKELQMNVPLVSSHYNKVTETFQGFLVSQKAEKKIF